MNDLTRLRKLAASQHGLAGSHQWRALEIESGAIRRAVRRGELERLSRNVVAIAGSPPTPARDALAAVLDLGDGAVLTSSAGGALWGLPGYDLADVDVLVAHSRRYASSSLGATVHTTRVLPPHHVTTLDGIPVVTPTRLLFELSWHVHEAKLERTLDAAWARGLTTGPMLRSMLRDLARRGRPLVATMRRLIEARPVDYRPPESGLEARFQQILARDGQRPLRRQVDTGDGTRWLGRVDFRDDPYPYVAQIDGDRYHTALLDRDADERQTAALIEAGYVVDRIRGHDVWHRADDVCAQVRRGRDEARRRVEAATVQPSASQPRAVA